MARLVGVGKLCMSAARTRGAAPFTCTRPFRPASRRLHVAAFTEQHAEQHGPSAGGRLSARPSMLLPASDMPGNSHAVSERIHLIVAQHPGARECAVTGRRYKVDGLLDSTFVTMDRELEVRTVNVNAQDIAVLALVNEQPLADHCRELGLALVANDGMHDLVFLPRMAGKEDGHCFVGWLTSLAAAEHCGQLLRERRVNLVMDLDETLIFAQHVPPAALAQETLLWQEAVATHSVEGHESPLEVPYRWAREPLPKTLANRSDGAYLVVADGEHARNPYFGLAPHRFYVRKGWHGLRSFLLEHASQLQVSVLSLATPTYVHAAWSVLDPPEQAVQGPSLAGAGMQGSHASAQLYRTLSSLGLWASAPQQNLIPPAERGKRCVSARAVDDPFAHLAVKSHCTAAGLGRPCADIGLRLLPVLAIDDRADIWSSYQDTVVRLPPLSSTWEESDWVMRGVSDLACWHWAVVYGSDSTSGVALDLKRAATALLHTLTTLPDPGLSMEGLIEHQVQTTGRSLWAALTTVPTATRTGGLLRGEPVCSHSEVPYQEL